MEAVEALFGRAIIVLVWLVITLVLLGLISRALRWLCELWGGRG